MSESLYYDGEELQRRNNTDDTDALKWASDLRALEFCLHESMYIC